MAPDKSAIDPLSLSLSPGKAGHALAYWCAGRNTNEIERLLGEPEARVANEIPKLLERKRLAKAI